METYRTPSEIPLDQKLDDLLSRGPVSARPDFLASVRFQLNTAVEKDSPELDQLFKTLRVNTSQDFLPRIREKVQPATSGGERVIRFPVWLTRAAGLAALVALATILWMPESANFNEREMQPSMAVSANATPVDSELLFQNSDLNQIWALAQHLQPGQNLKKLDNGIESALAFMD